MIMTDESIKKFFEVISESDRQTRSQYHLTLGKLIEYLSKCREDKEVKLDIGGTLGKEHSYRGYYSDLAFSLVYEEMTAGKLLKKCKKILNSEYTGYKGGEYIMDASTPLWISDYGVASSFAVIGLYHNDGICYLQTKKIED